MNKPLAIGLLIAAAVVYAATARTPVPPPPVAPPAIDLSTAFTGPDAAKDAATLGAMADALADMIEWDGRQEEPLLKTGRSLDELRTRARKFVCDGQSLGERHPKMRELVGDYLDKQLGGGGGEVTDDQRAAWVNAYREVARSARHAIGR